ncbi:MAG: sigma-70 family RNA polymerase sigma factor [Planctomycetaceae bacterium]|nr:sigma-70 family RNA polymerase sigma factor [Planctomycetaceae bacterium]
MDEIIGRWVAGDAAAAEELYRHYFDRVKEFIIKRGIHIVDAEDIAQEAMIAGLEGLKAGRKPDRLTHWLLGIARHVSFGRKRPESDPALESVEDPRRRSAGSMAVRREMNLLLERTLEGMTANDRQIVDLLYRGGLSRKEIADRLDLPMEAVHARCERAHSRLRETLSRHFTEVARTKLEPRALSLEDIRALRPAFRQVIIARHLQGLSDRDAALQLQLPEATLRARLSSAYEMLHCDAKADFSKAKAEYRQEKEV